MWFLFFVCSSSQLRVAACTSRQVPLWDHAAAMSAEVPDPSTGVFASFPYLRYLLDTANRKFDTNAARIRTFQELLEAEVCPGRSSSLLAHAASRGESQVLIDTCACFHSLYPYKLTPCALYHATHVVASHSSLPRNGPCAIAWVPIRC